MELFLTNKILNQNFWLPPDDKPLSDAFGLGSAWIYSGPIWITLDQIILAWDRYGFILDQ
jgi:hypothetical protein